MPLTDVQTEAVTTVDKPVAVIAGAGSGKTRVLIDRYRHLVTDLKIPLYRILAFTFTEKAAGEIKERILKEKIIRPEEEGLTQIGTIHSFCSRLLRRHGPLLGLDPEFFIIAETDAIIQRDNQVKKYLTDKLNQRDALIVELIDCFGFNKLNKIFQQLLSDPYIFLTDTFFSSPETKEKEIISRAHSLFSQWLEEKILEKSLTFNDLEYLTATLLQKNKDIATQISQRFKHILVDEYQDTNPLQTEIINQIYQPSLNQLFIVGDPKQSIYRFRRADVALFRKTVRGIKERNGSIIQLNETFRIPPRLTESLNRVFTPLFGENQDPGLYRPLVSHHETTQGKLQIILSPNDKIPIDKQRRLEAGWIAQHLASQNLSPAELSETALLFRTGAPMNLYREELLRAGIPNQVTRTRHLLTEPEIRDFLHILTYLAGNKNLLTQTGILRSSFFSFSEHFIESFIRSGSKDFLDSHTLDLFTNPDDEQQWNCLVPLIAQWEKLKNLLSPSQLFQTICNDLELSQKIKNQRALNLEQWHHLLDSLEAMKHLTLSQLDEIIGWIRDNEQGISTLDLKQEAGSVQLMTIHAAKGLEFKWVFLPQLYASTPSPSNDFLLDNRKGIAFKQKSNDSISGLKVQLEESPFFTELKEHERVENREESKRLLYVAMTRTKNELFLFLKKTKKKIPLKESNNWNDWLMQLLEKESAQSIPLSDTPIWSGLANKLEQVFQEAPPPVPEEKGSIVPHKPVYTVSAIETYLRCEKEFELKYIHNIHPLPNMSGSKESPRHHSLASQQWGVLVHEVMQYLDFDRLSNEQTVIEQALVNQQIDDSGKKIEDNLKEVIKKLKSSQNIWNYLAESPKSYTEFPFMLDCENFYLKGTLDRLSQTDNAWIILDYKTDRITSEEEFHHRAASYAGQMACYALATSQILQTDQLKTALLFTEGPFIKIEEWNKEKLEEVKQRLKKIHESICKQPAFPYTQDQKNCLHCPYYGLNYCGIRNLPSLSPQESAIP